MALAGGMVMSNALTSLIGKLFENVYLTPITLKELWLKSTNSK